MGPNLSKLFADANLASTDEKDLDLMVEADNRLHDLFERHGEALIAALEKALQCFEITQWVKDYPANHWAPRAQQLLAQLEAEAQP